MYKCEIIADSINQQGNRLTSFLVTYPRIVHAEMLRHRMFSRNVASSRAIPFEKMVKDVEENPFIPIAWQKSHSGMQGTGYITDPFWIELNTRNWLGARNCAVQQALKLHKDIDGKPNVTKQLSNRLLEPFMWITELITTGEEGLKNFFSLRCPEYVVNNYTRFENKTKIVRSRKDVIKHIQDGEVKSGWEKCEHWDDLDWLKINKSQAEIHIQKIAEMMWGSYNQSEPKKLKSGEWHIPFGDSFDLIKVAKLPLELNPENTSVNTMKVKIATARCARLSYQILGTNPKIDYEADIKLHDRLLKVRHMSPMEHCARAMTIDEYFEFAKGRMLEIDHGDHYSLGQDIDNGTEGWCNNFKGWVSYRYLIENQ